MAPIVVGVRRLRHPYLHHRSRRFRAYRRGCCRRGVDTGVAVRASSAIPSSPSRSPASITHHSSSARASTAELMVPASPPGRPRSAPPARACRRSISAATTALNVSCARARAHPRRRARAKPRARLHGQSAQRRPRRRGSRATRGCREQGRARRLIGTRGCTRPKCASSESRREECRSLLGRRRSSWRSFGAGATSPARLGGSLWPPRRAQCSSS